MNEYMLSIIIIAKNEELHLPRLLQCIARQDYSDYEVILSDASSTDATREIGRAAGARIIEGGMPSVGRNRGAEAAHGELLLFLDADVVLPPRFLSENVAEFRERDLDAAGAYVVPDNRKFVSRLFHHALNFYMWYSQLVFPHMPGFCIFAKRSMHERIGGFDSSIVLSEDSDYVNRVRRRGRFRMLRSRKVHCSVRRFETEGYLVSAVKYVLIPLYRVFVGEIRTDVFKYRFDHYKPKKDRQ
ncbi:MAG: glycosyltransferase family 2 protein [Spirochaetota bacterium]